MELLTEKNYKWIYTYDYAPGSVWEPWKESADVPGWITGEAEAVAVRAKQNEKMAGKKLPAFLLMADSHFAYNGTWEDTVASLRAVAERIELTGIVHLGDLTDGWLPLDETRKIETGCIADLQSIGAPLAIVPGNHDYNYFRGNPEVCYPERPQYYIDYPGMKMRFIYIDSFDPKETVRYGFTEYCIHWLDATLRTLPLGYQALIFSHVPPLVRLQAWAKDIRNREKLIAVLDAYADRILAMLNGHNHCDLLFNDLHNGQFPIVSINCAKCEYFTEHKPEGAVVPERRLGDRTQESFDIMQIDAGAGTIYFTRFGAGTDRVVKEHKAYYESAVGADGTIG